MTVPLPAPRGALCSALALVACASPQTPGPTPVEEQPTTTRREVLRGGGGLASLVEYHPPANKARVIELRARADSLWPRVLAAYETAQLPIGEVDTRARSVGTSSVRAVGRFAGRRLSEYVDCGPGPLGAPAADTYIVTLRVTTELVPQDSGAAPYAAAPYTAAPYTTTVRSLVSAVAKANATQGDPFDCVSTGRLETRLVRLIAPAGAAVSTSAPAPR